MKIEYKFVNGENVYVEVYGEFEKIMIELNKNLHNNDRVETRRHISLELFKQDKEIKDNRVNIEEHILKKLDKDLLKKAISLLNLNDKELLYNLYFSEKPISQKECANKLNISASAFRKRLERLRKKLISIIQKLSN